MSAWSPRTQALLERARGGDDPHTGARSRVAKKLAVRVAAAAGIAAAGTTATRSAAAAAASGGLGLKALVVVGIGASVGVAGWQLTSLPNAPSDATHAAAPLEERRAEQTPNAAPRGSQDTAEAEARTPDSELAAFPDVDPKADARPRSSSTVEQPLTPREPDAPRDRSRGRSAPMQPSEARMAATEADARPSHGAEALAPASVPHPTQRTETPTGEFDTHTRDDAEPPPSAPEETLLSEARALRAAQQALLNGDAAKALRLLNEQEPRYRAGALQQERAAARVFALCALGQKDEGAAAAARFVARFPRSPLLSRVQAACR